MENLPIEARAFEEIKGQNGSVLVTYRDDDKGGYDWSVSCQINIEYLDEKSAWKLADDLFAGTARNS